MSIYVTCDAIVLTSFSEVYCVGYEYDTYVSCESMSSGVGAWAMPLGFLLMNEMSLLKSPLYVCVCVGGMISMVDLFGSLLLVLGVGPLDGRTCMELSMIGLIGLLRISMIWIYGDSSIGGSHFFDVFFGIYGCVNHGEHSPSCGYDWAKGLLIHVCMSIVLLLLFTSLELCYLCICYICSFGVLSLGYV